MSVDLSRTSTNTTTSSSLSVLHNPDASSDEETDTAPYVVGSGQKHRSAGTSNGNGSNRPRASSVVSLSSSSLTDPDELDMSRNSFANGSSSKIAVAGKSNASITSHATSTEPESEEEVDDEDDELVEVNQDGSARPLARIKKLLDKPPHEPKHRWETAYVYAFIERFTSIQKDSAYAPQTIFEFELALEDGDVPKMPEDVDDMWIPSLEPIFKDFVERIRRQDRATGGTGGIKGGWQAWIPWWVAEQRQMRAPDFLDPTWFETIRILKDRDDKNAIYKIDWDRKVVILKALVDYQICLCDEIKTYINDCYGYVSSYKPQPRTKEEKEQRAKERAEARAETAAAVAAAVAAITSKPKLEMTGTGSKDKGKEKEKEAPIELVNPLALRPIGSDTLKQIWYRIDDSPRLYVNSDPYSSKQNFVAVSDTPKEISELLTGLHAPPKQASTLKLSGPFAKAAEGGKKKKKEKKKKGKALLLENEEKLHAYIRDIVLPSIDASEIKESPYYERKNRFENRRTNMIKKVQREARMETLAAARTVDPGYGSLRSSTRLRRGAGAPVNGYDEHARDQEIEDAIRESERAAKRRRKAAGSDVDSDEDEEYDDKMELDANGNGHSDDEDNFLDDDDEEGGSSSRRPSRRKNRRTGASSSNTRVSIPGERRSSRQTAPASYTYRVPSPEIVSTTKSRKASIVRSHSPDFDLSNDFEDLKEEEPFGGLEEVWTMGRYRGYYRPDGTFIKAQKGDIPLYKLAKMGLPLPPLTGPIPGSSTSNDDATTSNTKSKASSTAQSIAERIARINGEVPSSSSSKPQSTSNGKQAANQSMDLDGDEFLPASAVPTLLADDRETDDSHVLPDDSAMDADDDDDDDESDIVVVSSSSSKKPTTNGKTMNTAKESTQEETATKEAGGARDTSHISIVV